MLSTFLLGRFVSWWRKGAGSYALENLRLVELLIYLYHLSIQIDSFVFSLLFPCLTSPWIGYNSIILSYIHMFSLSLCIPCQGAVQHGLCS